MSTVGTVTIATVANVAIGRLLGAARYGNVALLTLSLGVALVITNAGVVSAAIQWGSQLFSDGDEPGALRLLAVSNGWHLYVQAPLMTVVVMSIAWHDSWLVKGGLLVGVIVPCIVSGAAVDLVMEHRTDAGAKVALGSVLFVQVMPVIVAAESRSAVAVWSATVATMAVSACVALIPLSRQRRRDVLKTLFPWRLVLPAGYRRFAWLSMVSDVLNLLVTTRSEIFLLALLTSSKVVGVYALAFGIAGQLTAPVDALLGPLVPAASGLVGRDTAKAAVGYLRAVRVSTLLATCLMVIAVPGVSRLIPLIYGHSFDGASRLFVALAISSCFATCLNPTIAFLAAHRAAGTALWTNVGALAVDAVIAVSLIPFIGAYGAVCAAVAASVVRLLVWTRTEVRRLGLAWRSFLVDVAVFVTGAVVVVLGVVVGLAISGPLGVVVQVAAPVVVFFGLLRIASGGLSDADSGPMLDVLPVRWRPSARSLLGAVGVVAGG
ncbi:MAG TPA: oligosaccharide flippase family protein [Mycobacteriales bacterium]|nr:oligosaccharide flippase family protein [Mycobacteriales bacterium]